MNKRNKGKAYSTTKYFEETGKVGIRNTQSKTLKRSATQKCAGMLVETLKWNSVKMRCSRGERRFNALSGQEWICTGPYAVEGMREQPVFQSIAHSVWASVIGNDVSYSNGHSSGVLSL